MASFSHPIRHLLAILALAAAGLLPAAAHAGVVVYDGGAPLHDNAVYSDRSFTYDHAAMQATLGGTTRFDSIEWWGAYFDLATLMPVSTPGVDVFELRIYGASGGLPGALLYDLVLGNTQSTALNAFKINGGTSPDYDYRAAFAAITLNAGDYFFSLSDDDGVTSSAWTWLTSDDLGGSGIVVSQDGAQTWHALPFGRLAFALGDSQAGTVPEPSTGALLAMAALGWGFSRRLSSAFRSASAQVRACPCPSPACPPSTSCAASWRSAGA